MKWQTVTLSEAVGDGFFIDGDWVESKDQDPNGDVRLIQLADVGINRFVDKSHRFMTSDAAKRLRCTMLEPGDILVARMPDPIGRACIFPGDSKPCATVVDVCIIRPNTQISNPRFLVHLFNSPRFQQEVAQFVTGTTRQRISRGNLNKIPFPLPPVPEQERIAARLDAADQLRAWRRDALARLDALMHSLFKTMFPTSVREPLIGLNPQERDGECWMKLTDVARLVTGHTPSRRHPEYWGGDIPWISLTEIRSLDCKVAYDTSEHATVEGIAKSSAVIHPAGTVCFSRTASVGFVTMMGRPMSTSQDFVNWICGEQLNPTYLMFALRYSRESLRALSSGSTHKTIYFPTVEEFRAFIPPLSLQQEFADKLAQIETVRARMEASRVELDGLFASLQNEAFGG